MKTGLLLFPELRNNWERNKFGEIVKQMFCFGEVKFEMLFKQNPSVLEAVESSQRTFSLRMSLLEKFFLTVKGGRKT